jgi:hypothetical protein
MVDSFTDDELKIIKWEDINKLDYKDTIIVDLQDKYNRKLNANIIDVYNKYIHVRYYDTSNNVWWTLNENEEHGIDPIKYEPTIYNWLDKEMFVKDGCDDIILYDPNNIRFYYSYHDFPFFSGKFGNNFTNKYYITKFKVNKLQLEYNNTKQSIIYTELPEILKKELKMEYPVRIKNNYTNILGCIIDGIPKKVLQKIILVDNKNIEECIIKYILLHLNNSFIKLISKKYKISIKNTYLLKNTLHTILNNSLNNLLTQPMIIYNYELAVLCSELFPINIRIFKYIDINNIEIIYIKNKNLLELNIYSTGNVYELIVSKNYYNKIKYKISV